MSKPRETTLRGQTVYRCRQCAYTAFDRWRMDQHMTYRHTDNPSPLVRQRQEADRQKAQDQTAHQQESGNTRRTRKKNDGGDDQ